MNQFRLLLVLTRSVEPELEQNQKPHKFDSLIQMLQKSSPLTKSFKVQLRLVAEWDFFVHLWEQLAPAAAESAGFLVGSIFQGAGCGAEQPDCVGEVESSLSDAVKLLFWQDLEGSFT